MTCREYARAAGFEIVGKLHRKTYRAERFDDATGEYRVVTMTYYTDDAGNEYHPGCIITKDGAII